MANRFTLLWRYGHPPRWANGSPYKHWFAQLGQLGQGETIKVCASTVGLDKGINYFSVDSAGGWLSFSEQLFFICTEPKGMRQNYSVVFDLRASSGWHSSVLQRSISVDIVWNFTLFWVSDWTGGISSVGRAHDCRAGGRGFDSRAWTITQGLLKISEKWRCSLCTSSGWTFPWLGWPGKVAVLPPVGDEKIVSTISTFVVNTFALKWSCTPPGPVRPR